MSREQEETPTLLPRSEHSLNLSEGDLPGRRIEIFDGSTENNNSDDIETHSLGDISYPSNTPQQIDDMLTGVLHWDEIDVNYINTLSKASQCFIFSGSSDDVDDFRSEYPDMFRKFMILDYPPCYFLDQSGTQGLLDSNCIASPLPLDEEDMDITYSNVVNPTELSGSYKTEKKLTVSFGPLIDASPFLGKSMFRKPTEMSDDEDSSTSSDTIIEEDQGKSTTLSKRTAFQKKTDSDSSLSSQSSDDDDTSDVDEKELAQYQLIDERIIKAINNFCRINEKVPKSIREVIRICKDNYSTKRNLIKKNHKKWGEEKINSYMFKKTVRYPYFMDIKRVLSKNRGKVPILVDFVNDLDILNNYLTKIPQVNELPILKSIGYTLAMLAIPLQLFTDIFNNTLDHWDGTIVSAFIYGYIKHLPEENLKVRQPIREKQLPTIIFNDELSTASLIVADKTKHIDIKTSSLSMDYYNLKLNSVIKSIMTQTKIIIFDVSNMIRHMNLTLVQIELLAKFFNNIGISTIVTAETRSSIIENASINVLIDEEDHDDIVAILYSKLYNGVIFTKDFHTEFVDVVLYCKTHNCLMVRVNEKCKYDSYECKIIRIKTSNLRYMSCKECVLDDDGGSIVFDMPIIRDKKTKPLRTTKVQIDPSIKKLGAKMYITKFPGDNTSWVKQVKGNVPSKNSLVLTLSYDSLSTSVFATNISEAITTVSNNLSEDTFKLILEQTFIVLGYIDGEIVLSRRDKEKKKLLKYDKVSTMRHKSYTKLMSRVLNTDYSLTSVHHSQKMKTLIKDNNEDVDYNYEEIILNKVLLAQGLAVLYSKSSVVFTRLTEEFCKMIKRYVLTKATERDMKTLDIATDTILDYDTDRLTLADFEITGKLSAIEQTDRETGKNLLPNIILGPTLYKQIADIDSPLTTNAMELFDGQGFIDDTERYIVATDINTKPTYYSSSESLAMLQLWKSTSNSHKFSQITYRIGEFNVSTGLTQISKADSQIIIAEFNRNGINIVKKIIQDINTVLHGILTAGAPVHLPPFRWSYKTDRYKHKKEKGLMLVQINYETNDYKIKIYVLVSKSMIFSIDFKPSMHMLLPMVAYLHGNNAQNMPMYNKLMEFDIETQFDVMCYEPKLQANPDLYYEYFKVFSLPMRLVGLQPFEELVKYDHLITDNIITDYKLSDQDNYWDRAGCVAQLGTLLMFDMTDEVYGALPIVRIKKNDDQIDLYQEAVDVLNNMVMAKEMNPQIVSKYLPMIRVLLPLDVIVDVGKQFYNLQFPINPTFEEVVSVLETGYWEEFYGDASLLVPDIAVDDVHSLITMQDKKKVTTTKGLFKLQTVTNISSSPEQTFEQRLITNEIPYRGVYNMLIISMESDKIYSHRYDVITKLQESSNQLKFSKYYIKVNFDTLIVPSMKQMIEQVSRTTRHSWILISSDKIGSIIKKQQLKDSVKITPGCRFYVPDTLLYNAVRSYVEVVYDMSIKTRKTLYDEDVEIKGQTQKRKPKKKRNSERRQSLITRGITYLKEAYKQNKYYVFDIINILVIVLISNLFYNPYMFIIMVIGYGITRYFMTKIVNDYYKKYMRPLVEKSEGYIVLLLNIINKWRTRMH